MIITHEGRVVLVVGGSAGIGREIASAFAREGAKVALCSRRRDVLDQAVEEIRSSTGGEVFGVPADIGNRDDARNFVKAAAERFGRIDILVNNAHEPILGMPTELDDDIYEDTLRVKPLGFIYCSLEAVSRMRTQGGGLIINILGDSLRSPGIGVTAGIANASALNFAKGLSDEVAQDNIRVICVAPGLIDTRRWPWISEYMAKKENLNMTDANRRLLASIPLGRLGKPEEIANVVLFAASDLASYMTGCLITVDGGMARNIL